PWSPTARHAPFFYCPALAAPGTSTLSLHDALPICLRLVHLLRQPFDVVRVVRGVRLQLVRSDDGDRLILLHRIALRDREAFDLRSEEHTSELQSLRHVVCRLLLEKKRHGSDAVAQS